MKRIGLWVIALALGATPIGRAQDAATEERLKQLSGKVEDLLAGQDVLRKRVEELSGQLDNLRQQQNRPAPNYAGQEDLKRLAKAVEEVDSKRLEDNRKIRDELLRLIEAVKAAPAAPERKTRAATTSSSSKKNNPPPSDLPADDKGGGTERGFYYTVAEGDSLLAIVAACREKHVMVTMAQILKANPRVKPDILRVGMKLFIPQPQPPKSSQ
jgi:TolA-binding protein